MAQDAVLTLFGSDIGDINFDYNDAIPSISAEIKLGVVDLTNLADMATQRLVGRNTAAVGTPEHVTISQVLDWTGGAAVANGDILYRTGGACRS